MGGGRTPGPKTAKQQTHSWGQVTGGKEGGLVVLRGSELQSDLGGTKKANQKEKSISISELDTALSCP